MSKIKTNEQCIRSLLKDMSTFEAALLRERLLKIAELTRIDLKKNPEGYNTQLSSPWHFEQLCNKIDKHLKTD